MRFREKKKGDIEHAKIIETLIQETSPKLHHQIKVNAANKCYHLLNIDREKIYYLSYLDQLGYDYSLSLREIKNLNKKEINILKKISKI